MLKYICYIKTNYYVSNIKIKIFLKLIILEKIINKLLFFYEHYQAALIDALKMIYIWSFTHPIIEIIILECILKSNINFI